MKNLKQQKEILTGILRSLPDKPGVYQYLDINNKIIYVGKAKNLRKRVSSYFTKEHFESGKLKVLVKKVHDIKFIVVNSELDALLLENNLIKKYQPRYNVQLKDDKSFPWICIKNEPFPRIFPTRNVIHDGSSYYGPYASVRMMNTLLNLIRDIYPLRTCTYHLSDKNIQQKKIRICLQYHIGNCKGPCEGRQSEKDYMETIGSIKKIIKGNIHSVIASLRELMIAHAGKMEFEKAQILKDQINILQKYQSKSTIVTPSIENADVFCIINDLKTAYINFIKVVNGAVIQSHTMELRKKLDEDPEDLLKMGITELRQRHLSDADELIVPLEINLPGITITVPKRGDKKKLVELSERNATYFKLEKEKQLEIVDPVRHTNRILETMMHDLKLKELPDHIECFDNSNFGGSEPVAAMVVFKHAKPSKKDYRHFNIKTVQGANDFASMEEVIYRRYKRLQQEEKKDFPKLIIVDGGKGQLSAALKSLEILNLTGKIPVIGIAKKLEEVFFPGDPMPYYIDKKSETLKIIQHLRNEAHRFGITHHRNRRNKNTIKSELTDIDGIGPSTAKRLLLAFKSVKNVQRASLEDIQQEIGKAKGQLVFSYFRS